MGVILDFIENVCYNGRIEASSELASSGFRMFCDDWSGW